MYIIPRGYSLHVFSDVKRYQKMIPHCIRRQMQNSFVLSPQLRLRQAKMASKKVDVWRHVLTALRAAGFGSDSTLEVAA